MSQEKLSRLLQGTVISQKMNYTVTVEVVYRVLHPIFKKVIRRSSKFHVHNPDNCAKVGDLVKIAASRPISKTKQWVLTEITRTAKLRDRDNI